ncbi:MAG: hypothetical protein SPL35_07940 [Bacteroidales bacterium]|nr:hypothetical protein [Bacteroidales bacterium]
MENWRYSFLAAALLAAACGDLEPEVSGTAAGTEDVPTKATLALLADSQVNSLAVWIMSGDDTTYVSSAGNGLVAECRADEAKIFAAGNIAGWGAGDGAPVRPHADTVTANLAAMTANNITCSFALDQTLLPGINELEIQAPRDICKITLEKVENRISEGAYAGKTITVEKVFLINGVGKYRIFAQNGSSSGRWWFSPSGMSPDAVWNDKTASHIAALVKPGEFYMNPPDLSYSNPWRNIAHGASETLNLSLYTGPNDTEEDFWAGSAAGLQAGGWVPRKTRLVLQCQIDGHRCYYPLTIDKPKANCHYIVRKLVITRFGTDYPDQPFDFSSSAASILLATWDNHPLREII